MGKQLIIKGADFSANSLPAAPRVPVNLWRPNVTDGVASLTDGYFTTGSLYENRAVSRNAVWVCYYTVLIQVDEPGTYEWSHPTDGKAVGKTGKGLEQAVSWRSMSNPTAASAYIAGDTSWNTDTDGHRRIGWPEGQSGPLYLLIHFVAEAHDGSDMANTIWNSGQCGYLTRAQLAQCTLYKVDD